MTPAAQRALAERDARLASHGREGFQLASADPTYRSTVLARLTPDLSRTPDDLWAAIPWTWALTLGAMPPAAGAMVAAVVEAAALLRDWLTGDEPLDALEARWSTMSAPGLGLGSTLRSHPFPDLRSWSIRPLFAASSSTPPGS